MVRCKMKVTKVSNTSSAYGTGKQEYAEVELSAAMGDENKTWSKWTPGGSIKLSITNPDAFKQFEVGDFFFVDFSPAPAKEADEKSG